MSLCRAARPRPGPCAPRGASIRPPRDPELTGPPEAGGRPPGRNRPHHEKAPASASRPEAPGTRPACILARTPDAAGDLRAWLAAVEHLHAAGLPAAVPPFPAAWLRRRGVRADWTVSSMSENRQLALFAATPLRQPLSREQVRLARRVVRTVRARGPIAQADLVGILGCTPAEARFAIGIAVQWRRIERRDGCLVATPREGRRCHDGI